MGLTQKSILINIQTLKIAIPDRAKI